ncbi:SCO family protein [Salinibacter altiplanensis]|uniref:SCO family protein n=1 Tax=Salinibacter altiplanensis TaxID=1803181 RepID=UPI000C9F0A47|nr:SCO family protein [Salinibacter altiplanensis]
MSNRRFFLLGTGFVAFLLVAGALLLYLFGTQTYTVNGRVAGIQEDGRTLVVEHEEIPGYMPPMIMPLPVADSSMTAPLEKGEAIQFRLAVGDSASIIAVRPLPDTAVARNPARSTTPIKPAGSDGPQMLQEGDRVPAGLTLTTQAGEPIRMSDYRGQALALTFIYTRCPLPTYCPLMSKQFAALQPTLRKQYGQDVQLLSISFDPAYDTPQVLREYAAKYTDRLDTWTFATGDSTQVQRATELFGVSARKTAEDEITHNLTTALIGPEGRVQRLWRGNDWVPEDVREAVGRLEEDV